MLAQAACPMLTGCHCRCDQPSRLGQGSQHRTHPRHSLNNPPRLPPRIVAPRMETVRKAIAQTPRAAAYSVPLPRVLSRV